jgi:hypothetical protein
MRETYRKWLASFAVVVPEALVEVFVGFFQPSFWIEAKRVVEMRLVRLYSLRANSDDRLKLQVSLCEVSEFWQDFVVILTPPGIHLPAIFSPSEGTTLGSGEGVGWCILRPSLITAFRYGNWKVEPTSISASF